MPATEKQKQARRKAKSKAKPKDNGKPVDKTEESAAPEADWCNFKERFLDVTRVPSFDEAAATGVALSAMTSDMPCWIGDFVNFCEATFGEKFSQILSLFPEGKYQTVANYTSVCKRVKPHVRRKELFFSHYDAVAKLDESKQIHWLKVAVDEGLSSRALRAAIAKSLRPVEPTKKDEAEKDDEDILIEAMKVALRNTRKAADLILTVDPKAGPAQAELKEAEHKLEGALWHFGVEVER